MYYSTNLGLFKALKENDQPKHWWWPRTARVFFNLQELDLVLLTTIIMGIPKLTSTVPTTIIDPPHPSSASTHTHHWLTVMPYQSLTSGSQSDTDTYSSTGIIPLEPRAPRSQSARVNPHLHLHGAYIPKSKTFNVGPNVFYVKRGILTPGPTQTSQALQASYLRLTWPFWRQLQRLGLRYNGATDNVTETRTAKDVDIFDNYCTKAEGQLSVQLSPKYRPFDGNFGISILNKLKDFLLEERRARLICWVNYKLLLKCMHVL